MDRTRPRFREHPLEWFLGLFADVRPGEAATALLLATNVFFLLCAYYLLKVAREPLILLGGGAEVKSYASAGQSVLLVGVAAAYGLLARHVDRMRLIAFVTLFFASNLVLFWFLGTHHVRLGVPFYLWVGIFNLTVVAQFWAFAADVYDESKGKRLFPILGIGSSIGAVAGAELSKHLIAIGPFGLMLLAAAILVGCLGLTSIVHRRARREHASKLKHEEETPLGGENGFKLLLADRYLLLIGALALILNAVNSTGEYLLDRTLLHSATEGAAKAGLTTDQFVGAFKARYFMYVNALGVALQLFAVSRIIRYLGLRKALFVMPIVSGAFYGGVAMVPALGIVLAAKVAENGLDYSLQNTAAQALWLPTARQAKYKVKQVVDTFLVRAGDVTSASLVWVGTHLAFSTRTFAFANLILIAAWACVLILLAREHAKRVPEQTSTLRGTETRQAHRSQPSGA
ncbi:MAG: NTP/NDP exchange transporter [Polyangiales bacterium]